MRCPNCHQRFIKSSVDDHQIFIKKLVLNRKDGSLLVVCSACKSLVKPDKELIKSLKSAFLLLKE